MNKRCKRCVARTATSEIQIYLFPSIFQYFYLPQMPLREGNIFTGVCLFTGAVGHMVEYPLPQEMSGRVPPGKVR